MTKNECIKMFLPLFATAIMACGSDDSGSQCDPAHDPGAIDSGAQSREETVNEDCKNGQAVHVYDVDSETIARTTRAYIHVIIDWRDTIYVGAPGVENTNAASSDGPQSTVYVTCGPNGSYVEFVRDL